MTMLKYFITDQMFRRLSMPVMVTVSRIGVFASKYFDFPNQSLINTYLFVYDVN